MYLDTDNDFYAFPLGRMYVVLFYNAIILLVGNEINPTTELQTVYSSLIVILGAITNAFIFGNMAALMQTMNR